MKKKIIISIMLVLLASLMLTGCKKQETYANGVPTYFLEPDGYIIAEVILNDSTMFTAHYLYGYILEEDYQSYLNGTLTGILVVKNPYRENSEVSTPVGKIDYIEVGSYRDLRYRNN